jgi:predicted nucleotidyltransferase
MDKTTKHISSLIKLNVSQVDPAAQVILYGSRARGDSRTDSDWDLLILTEYPVDNKKESIFRDHLYELELQTGQPFSVFVYSKEDWSAKHRISPYYYNVTREGILL